MKIVCCAYLLLPLCLILLSGPCPAGNLTSSPSLTATSSSLDEPIHVSGTMKLLRPSVVENAPASFYPPEDSISMEHPDGPVQVAADQESPEALPVEALGGTIADPLEPINRVFFYFNDKLYFWIFKPVAIGYKTIIPEDGRIGVRNFFSNLATPIRLANCVFQAKFKGAGNETIRFVLNTTFGLAGFLDPAKKEFKIEKQDEDFGQTLGVWGLGPAFYIDWPILGPSSLRDSFGFVGDILLDPRTYVLSDPIFYVFRPVELINETSLNIGEYEDLKEAALDPYIALREAYHQYRQNKLRE